MSRHVAGALLVAALAGGCMQDDAGTKDRVDRLLMKAEALERKLDGIQKAGGLAPANAPPQQPPRPAGPDPLVAYSVPIEGDPSRGPGTAKVTIVEAADFA